MKLRMPLLFKNYKLEGNIYVIYVANKINTRLSTKKYTLFYSNLFSTNAFIGFKGF